MKLIHFSNDDEITLGYREQTERSMKPRGLWISDESDYGWSQWCRDEEFGRGDNAFAVQLAQDAKILILTISDAVREFHRRFNLEDFLRPEHARANPVDWPRVARQWQGLIITPYQWDIRLAGPLWYYVWDCASGCIWDPAAIESLTLLPDWTLEEVNG